MILLLLVAPELRTKCQDEDGQSLLHCEGMHQAYLGIIVKQFQESYLGNELRTKTLHMCLRAAESLPEERTILQPTSCSS